MQIIPEKDLWQSLLKVEKPGRYIGGEYGIYKKKKDENLKVVLSYPDLYEIGMSNLAVRLLYSRFNSIFGVSCERVFAPAPDFEEELRNKGFPLYSLESGTPLNEFDLIGFSIGYELTVTNMLTILDLGNIPVLASKRLAKDPIVIAGGPAVINPAPYSMFVDLIFIGEADGKIEEVFSQLVEIKKRGGMRDDLIDYLIKQDYIWSPFKKNKKVFRNIWMNFSESVAPNLLPVPNIRVVQDQGVTEIMRGCPNICRFCQACIYYRPFRYKKPYVIIKEIENLIENCGYRNISLSSLSTGDYYRLDKLIQFITNKYKDTGIYFSLPSLRVDTMTLSILKNISEIRRSGLTFAIETPKAEWQAGINKKVSLNKIISILHKAKEMGWKLAKFYFMIGLPIYDIDESEDIVNFLCTIQNRTGMIFHVNISTFVPKPHTPFQWASQLSEEEALTRIMYIKKRLPRKYFKVGYHSPFASVIEGIISRGDKNVGELLYKAFMCGARLDAWEEYIKRDVWRKILKETRYDYAYEITKNKKQDEILPWEMIDMGVSKNYLKEEWEKALQGEYTPLCSSDCNSYCGVCNNNIAPTSNIEVSEYKKFKNINDHSIVSQLEKKIILSFSKKGKSSFLSHLDILNIIERAFLRAGYLIKYKKGFNPKPRIEFASPLSLGIDSEEEILTIEIKNFSSIPELIKKVNRVLPEGIKIIKAKLLKSYMSGMKKVSLASIYWGSDYFIYTIKKNKIIPHLLIQLNDIENTDNNLKLFLPALDSFFLINEGLCIRWKKVNKKGININNFLKIIMCKLPSEAGIKIKRLKCHAIAEDQGYSNYFDIMER